MNADYDALTDMEDSLGKTWAQYVTQKRDLLAARNLRKCLLLIREATGYRFFLMFDHAKKRILEARECTSGCCDGLEEQFDLILSQLEAMKRYYEGRDIVVGWV